MCRRTLRPYSWPRPLTMDSLPTASAFTANGSRQVSLRKSTSIQKAATASGCGNRTCLPTNGSSASGSGSVFRDCLSRFIETDKAIGVQAGESLTDSTWQSSSKIAPLTGIALAIPGKSSNLVVLFSLDCRPGSGSDRLAVLSNRSERLSGSGRLVSLYDRCRRWQTQRGVVRVPSELVFAVEILPALPLSKPPASPESLD